MNTYQTAINETPFSNKAIARQLERIFLDPHFAESEILKRFLAFIIKEMLAGRSNQLKEYTIALNVLDKPIDFNPKENGIVRIHAGRLRRALYQYYSGIGVMDELLINIPKGNYIPLISNRTTGDQSAIDNVNDSTETVTPSKDAIVVAVLPFLCLYNSHPLQLFTHGLCLHLTESLMQLKNVTVISYHAVRSLSDNIHDVRELATLFGADYMVAGSIQFHKGDLRTNIQVMNGGSCKQVWSKLYEGKLNHNNVFKVEDEITSQVCSELQETPQFTALQKNLVTMSVVAG